LKRASFGETIGGFVVDVLNNDDLDVSPEVGLGGDVCRSSVKLSRWGNKSFSTLLPSRFYGPEPPNDALTSQQNIPINGSSLLDVPAGLPHSPSLLQTDGTHGVRCYHGVVAMTKATTWRTGLARHISDCCAFQV
jgi:hypothetical protein